MLTKSDDSHEMADHVNTPETARAKATGSELGRPVYVGRPTYGRRATDPRFGPERMLMKVSLHEFWKRTVMRFLTVISCRKWEHSVCWGATIPEEYGGAGGELCFLWSGCPRSRTHRFRIQISYVGSVFTRHASHFCLRHRGTATEISARTGIRETDWLFWTDRTRTMGSDAGGMLTRAKKTDGGYSISGAKNWITNSPVADVMVVWAKSDAHDGKIRGFILERGMAGLETPKIGGQVFLAGLPLPV